MNPSLVRLLGVDPPARIVGDGAPHERGLQVARTGLFKLNPIVGLAYGEIAAPGRDKALTLVAGGCRDGGVAAIQVEVLPAGEHHRARQGNREAGGEPDTPDRRVGIGSLNGRPEGSWPSVGATGDQCGMGAELGSLATRVDGVARFRGLVTARGEEKHGCSREDDEPVFSRGGGPPH